MEEEKQKEIAKTESKAGCCGPAENAEKIEHVETPQTDSQAGCCGSGIEVKGKKIGTKSVLIGGGALILGLLLLTGQGGMIWGALPFLILLACPLMHVFMHGGKGHKH